MEFRDEQVQEINLPVNVQADGALRHACMSTTSLQPLPNPNCRDVSGRTPGQPAIPARLGNADLPITEVPKPQKQAQAMQAYAASAPRGRGDHAVEASHQKNVFSDSDNTHARLACTNHPSDRRMTLARHHMMYVSIETFTKTAGSVA